MFVYISDLHESVYLHSCFRDEAIKHTKCIITQRNAASLFVPAGVQKQRASLQMIISTDI